MKCSGFLRTLLPVAFILLHGNAFSQSFKAFAVNDLARIYEDGYKLPSKTDTLKLFGIRGEIISGQIGIQALAKVSDLAATAGALKNNPNSAGLGIVELNFVGSLFLPTNAPNQPSDKVERKAPSFFPEYLMKENSVEIEKGKYKAVWVTVKIPEDAGAGTYTGFVRLESGNSVQSVPLSLKVYPLNMPSQRHLKIAVRFSVSLFDKYHGTGPDYSPAWFDMLKKYAVNMAEHRQNVMQAPLDAIITTREADGTLSFDFNRFDQVVEVFMNTGKFDFIETGYGLTRFGEGDWFSRNILLSDFKVRDARTGDRISMPGEKFVAEFLPEFERHLRQKGWLEKTLLSVRNEPSLHNAERYRELCDYFHNLAPDLKQFESIETTEYGSLDIPGPKMDHLATWYDSFRKDQENGKEISYYIVGIYQGSRFPNMTADVPLMDSRIMPWMNYKYDLSGIKSWGWNSWTDDPFKVAGQHLGDGWHVYPVKGDILNSLRWEEMRNGIQDYEYFRLLEDRIKYLKDSLGTAFSWIDPTQRGKEIAGIAVKSFSDYTIDPQVLYSVKLNLIREILQLNQKPGLYVQTNPREGSTVTDNSTVEVLGWTEPGSKVTLNGKEVPVMKNGMFMEQLGGDFIDPLKFHLDDRIIIISEGPHGKKTEVRNFKIIR